MQTSATGNNLNTRAIYEPIAKVLQEAFHERLKTVVLFGSHARDDARPGSDHDLFVVITDLPRGPLARHRAVKMTLLPILDSLPGRIAFVSKTPQEVDANLTPLLLDVCVDGICLYGDDYFEPLRRKALQALEESGLRRRRVGGTWMWTFPKTPDHHWELDWDGYREYA